METNILTTIFTGPTNAILNLVRSAVETISLEYLKLGAIKEPSFVSSGWRRGGR